jgi:flagellar assembly protein FliH
MSCRIYSGAEKPRPVVWPEADSSRAAPQASGLDERTSGAEVAKRSAEIAAAAEAQIREARTAGFAAGRQAASEELAPVMERLSASVAEVASMRARLRKQAEGDLVKLAIAIAKRILRREVAVDPLAVQGIVSAALERIQARDVCSVTLHPDHERALRAYLETNGISAVRIAADSGLQKGDLRFETAAGTLDVSIDTQLSEIERGLVDRLGR